MTRRESGSCGPGRLPAGGSRPLPRGYRWCCWPALPRAGRRSRDARVPLQARAAFRLRSAIPGWRGPAISRMPGAGQEQSRHVCDSTCRCTFTDSIVAVSDGRAPARARISPGGAPRTGNADDAHAGPGWRTGPEMSRAGSAARIAVPAGVAQVRAVRRDAAAALQAVTRDHAGGGSDEISAGRSMR